MSIIVSVAEVVGVGSEVSVTGTFCGFRLLGRVLIIVGFLGYETPQMCAQSTYFV